MACPSVCMTSNADTELGLILQMYDRVAFIPGTNGGIGAAPAFVAVGNVAEQVCAAGSGSSRIMLLSVAAEH